jgi:hypothetical protein
MRRCEEVQQQGSQGKESGPEYQVESMHLASSSVDETKGRRQFGGCEMVIDGWKLVLLTCRLHGN